MKKTASWQTCLFDKNPEWFISLRTWERAQVCFQTKMSHQSVRKLGHSHWKWSVFVIGFGWECKLHKKIKADEEAKKGYEGINMGTTYLWINTTDDAVMFAEYMQGTWLPITFCCLVNGIYWSHLRFLAITELILFNTKSQELKKKKKADIRRYGISQNLKARFFVASQQRRAFKQSQYFMAITHSLSSAISTCVAVLKSPCTSANVLVQIPQRSSENRH